MSEIRVRHTQYPDIIKWAFDKDTHYWIFDDSPEPVGLTADLLSEWEEINE